MIFCTKQYQKNYVVFNKQIEKSGWEKIKLNLIDIKLSIAQWIDKKDMAEDEKNNNPIYSEIGGYLKTLTYKEAWKSWWNMASQTDKDKILSIPYFDAKVFEEITGLKEDSKKSLSGKIVKVEIDGASYEATIK